MALVDMNAVSGILARAFEDEAARLVERLSRDYYGDGPAPRSAFLERFLLDQRLDDIFAAHWPRASRALRLVDEAKERFKAARYRLGVAIIGYDPGPDSRGD